MIETRGLQLAVPPDWQLYSPWPCRARFVVEPWDTIDPADPRCPVTTQPEMIRLFVHTEAMPDGAEPFAGVPGLRAFRNPASTADAVVVDLPDVHMTVTTSRDPTVAAILATMTYSKHERALHTDAQPPTDWQTVTEAGISARVPAAWKVRHVPEQGSNLCARPVPPETAELGSDFLVTSGGPPSCELGTAPVDGFRLVGPPPASFPYSEPLSIAETRSINGVAVGIVDVNADPNHSVIRFVVHNADGQQVTGAIGAGQDPATAAAILASIKHAS